MVKSSVKELVEYLIASGATAWNGNVYVQSTNSRNLEKVERMDYIENGNGALDLVLTIDPSDDL